MENLYYDRNFVKSLRVYLRTNFTDVNTSYRYRNYTSAKQRGIVMTAKNNDCFMRFEIWGGSKKVEATFVFGEGEDRKFFRSHLEIGTGNFGEFLPEEFDFINKVLDKVSVTGNNALSFIMRCK